MKEHHERESKVMTFTFRGLCIVIIFKKFHIKLKFLGPEKSKSNNNNNTNSHSKNEKKPFLRKGR